MSARRLHPVGGDRAALHHQRDVGDIAQHGDVGERVAGDDDEVGELALLDRAELRLLAAAFGGP